MNKTMIRRILFISVLTSGLSACATETSTRSVGQLAVMQAGEELDGSGACAALSQAGGDCPINIHWDNHGQYVSCVAKYFSARVASGDLTEEAKEELVVTAARSNVGMPDRATRKRPDFAGLGGEGGDDEFLDKEASGKPSSPFAQALERVCE